jgi:hypothetical protein
VAVLPYLAFGCHSVEPEAGPVAVPVDTGALILSELRKHEAEHRRASKAFARTSPEGRFGADPYALVERDDGSFVGVLRGSSELVALGPGLDERQRVSGPAGSIGVAFLRGHLVALGEWSSALTLHRSTDLALLREVPIPDLYAGRAIAADEQRVFVVEEDSGQLLVLSSEALIEGKGRLVRHRAPLCNGPVRLVLEGSVLAVDCLLDQQIVVLDVSGDVPRERARITQDGPFWGLDVVFRDETVWIAATGAEDHPLDRSIGSFGYVDSFLYLFSVTWSGTSEPVRRLAENLSEQGLVVPKVVCFTQGDAGFGVFLAAYGSAQGLLLEFDEAGTPRERRPVELPPGSNAAVREGAGYVIANPLLDAWLRWDEGRITSRAEARSEKTSVRLGEALLFTNLMAPWNRADGAASRFSCETCHFEGMVDGRTHHTGRGDVRATTKPLFGLSNNRPHFSRALDEDLSEVVHAEFRVAGANSGRDPVFAIREVDHPWLARLALEAERHDALSLRRALMDFLVEFEPPRNPRTRGRSKFSPDELRGAELFRDRCEACHSARTSADDPASREPFERWESLVFGPGSPLVWGSSGYQKTGVTPYVHALGARTPSLRRSFKKHPYFTNGSAPDLDAVLQAVRLEPFSHQGGEGTPLAPLETAQLLAFLRLL